MKLTWRDLISTMLAIIVGIAVFAKLRSYDWAFIGSWKGAVGTLGILGGLMAIFDEADFFSTNTWWAIEGILAVTAIGLTIVGLFVASKVLFVLLAIAIGLFWLTSLSRHEFSHEPGQPHAVM